MTPLSEPWKKAERNSRWTLAMMAGVVLGLGLHACLSTTEPPVTLQSVGKAASGSGILAASQTAADPLRPPIRFSHKLHSEQAECEGCHATVKEGEKAGRPKLSDCLDCHDGMQSDAPADQAEEKKLEIYASTKNEIPWPALGSLASGTKFSHKVHMVEAELDCVDCHGDIAKTNSLPAKPAFPYKHALCGQCHEVVENKGQCRDCHVR